jgi:hypothetical protein
MDHTTSPIFDRACLATQSAISEAIAFRTSSTPIRVINMAESLLLSDLYQGRREMPTTALDRSDHDTREPSHLENVGKTIKISRSVMPGLTVGRLAL